MPVNPEITTKKFAIVTPWYGHQYGGAERFIREFAENLRRKGNTVEVCTTACSSPYVEWSDNDLETGETVLNGVPVRRFPVDERDAQRYVRLYSSLTSESAQSLCNADESALIENSINSRTLYQYIEENKSTYTWIFAPYMYGTTIKGTRIAPGRSLLFPCLHDEPMAHLPSVQRMFKNVGGVLCLSEPEKEMIQNIYSLQNTRTRFVGCGVEAPDKGNPDTFRKKFGIDNEYFLYIGKKDKGKNLHVLLDYFERFATDYTFRGPLVLVGPGDMQYVHNSVNESHVIDLGILDSETEKQNTLAGATALCHPSVHESFSIVIMESWLQRRPVIVDAACDVTREHCNASNGGLYYRNYFEFAGCLDMLLSNPSLARILGEQGRDYVREVFNWDAVIERFLQAANELLA